MGVLDGVKRMRFSGADVPCERKVQSLTDFPPGKRKSNEKRISDQETKENCDDQDTDGRIAARGAVRR